METLTGTVTGIKYKNEQNGWTVLELSTDGGQLSFDSRGETFAVGVLPAVEAGERVELTGEWVEHAEYGRQFKFSMGVVAMPDTLESIEAFLSSGAIKGIRAATAKNIIKYFGDRTLDVLEHKPWLLAEVKGVSEKRAAMIGESYAEKTGMRRTITALQGFGITTSQAAKLYKIYGDGCVGVINSNPYKLIEDVEGIGFRTADGIALNMGFGEESSYRVSSALKYTLAWARNDGGHTCYPMDTLIDKCAQSLSIDPDVVKNELERMIIKNDVCAREMYGTDYIYTGASFYCDAHSAALLRALCASPEEVVFERVESELSALEHERNIALDPLQRHAVLTAFESGALVITGGPGTGKTTIINFIIAVMRRQGLECVLCAPTGRAAKRMSAATGCEAKTIHRLLEYDGEQFLVNEEEPLEDCGVLIVDEMSMVDAWLFHSLLSALQPGTRIIMVGDVDQLPSVGAGNVLADIINSGAVPVVRLTEIFRQAAQSRIVVNAHMINDGAMPLLDFTDDFGFEEIYQQDAILQRLAGMLERGRLGDPMTSVQVLTPMRKGTLGVYNINRSLQQVLNPPSPDKAERAVGDMLLREGDKVMQIKNNYQLEWEKPGAAGIELGKGVFNGDMGIIKQIYADSRLVEIEYDDARRVFYEYEQLSEIELAYCVTIHKSQGSEFDTVVLPLCSGPPMLMTRNLLYTAVTRARLRVVILGRRFAIEQMISNNTQKERYSGLRFCLEQLDALYSQTASEDD